MRATAVLTLSLGLWVSGTGSTYNSGAPRTCGPATAPTVLENDLVRVYRESEDADAAAVVCNKRTRRALDLDDGDLARAYAVPGVDLTGPFVAAAVADNTLDEDPETDIALVDARKLVRGRDSAGAFVAVVGADRARAVARVGRVVVASNGDLAWSSCPASQASAEPDPQPNCVAAGAKDTVWTLRYGTRRPRAVARATTIDPHSVRLKRGRVSWVQDGERRSAAVR